MVATSGEEVYDLLLLIDTTASMGNYIDALKQALPQIISISALTNCFERIGLLAYRDYCDDNLLEWSGWMTSDDMNSSSESVVVKKASSLRSIGGGDYPEATKTGLARAHQLMRKEATTLILLYTDAPPHMKNGKDTGYRNSVLEREALEDPLSYDGYGPRFADWVTAAQTLRTDEKRAQVVSFLDHSTASDGHYLYLSHVTQGACLILKGRAPRTISQVTVDFLLAWMGVKKEGTASTTLPATLSRYVNDTGYLDLPNEMTMVANTFFRAGSFDDRPRLVELDLSTDTMAEHLPKKSVPLQDFAKTYKENAKYRNVVTTQLRKLIERDVVAISLNAVFGSLWRTFCNDRDNEHRQELLDLFGRKIDSITDNEQRTYMKTWLEESYDYTAEVVEAIESVPAEQRFPCVCLDPTLAFVRAAQEDGEEEAGDEQDQPITAFRRDELLEIGRSCDFRILRRLGRILTRLTYIESADAMPAHIAATTEANVPKIPMALASKEYGRRFWRILLHVVVPGTMLGARGATLLAALSIRLGVQPLMAAAEHAMLFWRNKWNDIDVPETWNVNCLSLLLDADKAHRGKMGQNSIANLSLEDEKGLLLHKDRRLFQRLVDYKLIELNLNTTLTAKVSWTPDKATMPIGPVTVCKSCEYPRSVTIMGPNNRCGLCYVEEWESPEQEQKLKSLRVSKKDNQLSDATWVECSMQNCRVQYVVYHVEGLNVRSKCHYCRQQGEAMEATNAPFVECTKCLSRMIWPLEYRPAETMPDWTCIACNHGRKSVVDVELTANQLRPENGDGWLLENTDDKIKQPFGNRTLFKVVSDAVPLDDLCDKVRLLPGRGEQELLLRHRGKPIQNTPSVFDQLESWVSRRRTQSGTCSLCFSSIRKTENLPACGRSGCAQRVCKSCLEGWYGLNAAGRILNTAALACPFCRRPPTAKVLTRYGTGIHAVAGLREAVDQRGEWIYAWCRECGHAKQFMERVCAGGAPPELENWSCDDCKEKKSGPRAKIRVCPGCGVHTEKISGCDHIECTECGTHWCFHCETKQDEAEIYNHMSEEHGGYYDGLDEEEYEDEEHDTD